eukprot:TRINITY_DN3689_c0_g2_i7.p4 TRINITY_DN3689_c0_g2~~TRINITY_DN3689_c0_g2_i7.p4  ORF type:complete len:128 (-),score=62.62 TRINITY_DN3689_c0_g2_i7:143-526(-)
MERGAVESLGGILKAVEDRTASFERLIAIKGKLELLLQLKGEEKKAKKTPMKYEAVQVIDENEEEEIPGVEVLSVNEFRSTAEMVEENADNKSQASEEMPDVVEDVQDDQEDIRINPAESENEEDLD